MRLRLVGKWTAACVLLVVGPVWAQDFTVQGDGNFNRDLPQRLTAGTWRARVSVPASDRVWLLQIIPYDGYDGYYGSLSFDADAPSDATFRVGTDRGADVPVGRYFVRPTVLDGRWSIRFTRQGGGAPPPGEPNPPTTPSDGTLQNGQFAVLFGATANGERVDGQLAAWASDKGILFWLFDSQNPEALFKVLDGRSINGHWWMDLAVTSDLRTATVAAPAGRVQTDTWPIVTGPASSIFSDETSSALVHCAFPSNRSDNRCSLSGLGTTISLRDAWNSQGRISAKYYTSSVGTAFGGAVAEPPSWTGRELTPVPANRP